jgi:hypothetical protein
MLPEETILKLADDVTFQSVSEDQTVILSLTSGYLFTCNGTTASFLAAISKAGEAGQTACGERRRTGSGPRTFGQAIDQLAAEYDAPRDRLLSDMADLVAKLVEEKLLVVEFSAPTPTKAAGSS